MPTRLTLAKADIVRLMDAQLTPVFKHAQLSDLFKRHRDEWRLPKTLGLRGFIDYLIQNSRLKRVTVDLPHRPETLYVWGKVSTFCMASALKPEGYLSHYTAMQIHELTDQSPATVYVNHEQRPQPKPAGPLLQASVDRAFKVKQRTSKNIAKMGKVNVCVLNGKHTGRLGVESRMDSGGQPVQVTSIERTLIDITVRPIYSGGVFEIMEAYRRAASRLQINRLLATLRKMDFVYPYQQAIGLYLEKSGEYAQSKLQMLEVEKSDIDFYLTYGMTDAEYSQRWRIFYPKGL